MKIMLKLNMVSITLLLSISFLNKHITNINLNILINQLTNKIQITLVPSLHQFN